MAARRTTSAARRRLVLAGCAAVTLLVGAVVVPPIGGGHAEEPPATAVAEASAPVTEQPIATDTTTTEATSAEPTTTHPASTEPTTTDPAESTATDPAQPTTIDSVAGDTRPTSETAPAPDPVVQTPVATTAESTTPPPPTDAGDAAANSPSEPAPAMLSPTFTSAALASTGLSIRLTDPLVPAPVELDLGPRVQGVDASAFVTIINDTGRTVTPEVSAFGSIQLGENTCDGVVLDAALGFNSCYIEIVIDTANEGPVSGDIEIFDSTPSALSNLVVIPVLATVFSGAPPNDDFENAQDISSVPVVPYRTAPDGTLLDTFPVSGTTEMATLEPGEDTNGGVRSVWYRYTSTGFEGRLGYQASAGFQVYAYADCPPDTVPTIADGCTAIGGAWDTFIDFARMEPGRTVWFRVHESIPVPDWVGGPFILRLFEAPNQADSIVTAPEVPGRGGRTGSQGGNYPVVGDTFGTTPDLDRLGQPLGAPNAWFTFVLNRGGDMAIELTSQDAAGRQSARPVELTLYRAPTRNRVTGPAGLVEVATGALLQDVFLQPTGITLLEESLESGRYYVEMKVGRFGPTFFDSQFFMPAEAGGDTDPPTVTITTPTDGAEYGQDVVPDAVVATCADDVDPDVVPSITVDDIATDELTDALGAHAVVVACTDDAGNSAVATSVYTVVLPELKPVVTISGPTGITVGSSGSVNVTASHPGGFGNVAPGFRFTVEVPFGGDLEVPPAIGGISCEAGFPSPDGSGFRHVVCTSENGLTVGQAVTMRFTTAAWTGLVLNACQPATVDGKLAGTPLYAGGICLNVLAYPGGWEPNSINRANLGGDAVILPIPLDGPYLRFTTSAPDTPEGSPVGITVTPRNPGSARQSGLAFSLQRYAPINHRFEFVSADTPPGWTCTSTSFSVDCEAPSLSLDAGETGDPIVVRMVAPAPGNPDTTCPATGDPLPSPRPDPCGGFSIFWANDRASIRTGVVAYRILPPAPPPPSSGPCVIVRTVDVEFGEVELGSDSEAPVTIESCSGAAVDLTVTISDATTSGSNDTWIASTSTTPPNDGQFRWTVTPEGGAESDPVGPGTTRLVGSLAASAARTDTHRIRLGPAGPGIGRTFTSTITYTALGP